MPTAPPQPGERDPARDGLLDSEPLPLTQPYTPRETPASPQ